MYWYKKSACNFTKTANLFPKFFHVKFNSKFVTKSYWRSLPHNECVTTLPCEISGKNVSYKLPYPLKTVNYSTVFIHVSSLQDTAQMCHASQVYRPLDKTDIIYASCNMVLLTTDRVSTGGNATASVCPSTLNCMTFDLLHVYGSWPQLLDVKYNSL